MKANEHSIAAEFKEYAYSVSHDLSAPVRAMVEFSKILINEHAVALNEEGKEYLSVIIENGHKMQAMMEGLLQYSRLNTMAKPPITLDANRMINDCRVVIQKQIAQTKTTFDIGTLPTITADIDQFTQLLLALLDNAIKFQPAGNAPHIIISAEEKAECWQFAIKDNGIGIPPSCHEKIFKLFARLHTENEYPGIGAGLTLAHKVVQRHGGQLWVESALGQGSTFYFTLSKNKT